MKKSLLLISTLLAASAGTAFAETTYTGTVYTVTQKSNSADLAYAKYTYDTVGSDGNPITADIGPDAWRSVNPLIASVADANVNTLKFTSTSLTTSGDFAYTFTPLKVAGLIVDDGSSVTGIVAASTTYNRSIQLGATGVTGYSTINDNFTLDNSGSSHNDNSFGIYGTQNWEIASGKTLTLKSSGAIVQAGALTISGEGTAKFASAFSSSGTISVGENSTLDLSSSGTVTLSSAITNAGTVTVSDTTVFSLANLVETNTSDSIAYIIIDGGTVTGKTFEVSDFTDPTTSAAFGSRWAVDQSAGLKIYAENQTITWTGAVNNTWDGTTENFNYAGSSPIYFIDGDSVLFATDGASIEVSGSHVVNQLTCANTTFTGTGSVSVNSLVSDSTLTWNAGTLTVNNDTLGTFTSAVVVGADSKIDFGNALSGSGTSSSYGTFTASNVTGTGTIAIAIGNTGWYNKIALSDNFTGTVEISKATGVSAQGIMLGASSFADGVTLKFMDGMGFANAGAITSNVNLLFAGTTHAIQTNSGTNNALTIAGDVTINSGATVSGVNGTMTFAGNISNSGTLKLTGGSLTLAPKSADVTTLNIGNIEMSTTTSSLTFSKATGAESTTYTAEAISMTTANGTGRTITIDEGVTVNATSFSNNWGFKTLTVNGTLNISGTGNSFYLHSGNMTNTITGTGTIDIAGTFWAKNVGTYVFDGGIKVYAASTAIERPVQLKNATLGNKTSDWTITNSGNISIGNATFDAAEGTTITLSNAMAGISGTDQTLTKIGLGEVVFDAVNTYTGKTSIQAGTLRISATGGISGAVEINGGQLKLGATSTATVELTALKIILDDYATTPAITGNESSTLTITGGDGTIEVTALALALDTATSYNFQVVDSSMSLATTLKAENFSLDSELANVGWYIDSYNAGTLTLAIPEPSMFGLLAGTLALALAGTRRRKNAK